MADTTAEPTASDLIDGRIADLGDWRADILARGRAAILAAVPDATEAWKWRGVPTWMLGTSILTTGETYKDKVKFTFAHGAKLADPAGMFNASLEGNARRAIDVVESDAFDDAAFGALISAAAELLRK